ncbi:hypothetical protein CIRG_00359 [Coccidioides immitis RMSCC 2394]|uniref:Uncharacterized protein n=1 Tax=Coccidioides immitis RMSCC 2394 TaxID=404692 RepID=A0A0J7ASI1_COCIT|nr:hypothetical protein CIRG_00359 [Coccidioides immitis RMSCC 2394]
MAIINLLASVIRRYWQGPRSSEWITDPCSEFNNLYACLCEEDKSFDESEGDELLYVYLHEKGKGFDESEENCCFPGTKVKENIRLLEGSQKSMALKIHSKTKSEKLTSDLFSEMHCAAVDTGGSSHCWKYCSMNGNPYVGCWQPRTPSDIPVVVDVEKTSHLARGDDLTPARGWQWNVRSSMFGVVIGERRPAKSPRIDGVFCRVRTNARAKLSAGWSDETTAHRPQRKMRGAMTTLLICHPRGEEWTCLITRRTWGTAAEILPRCKRTMKALDVGGPFCAHRERAV